MNQREQEIFLRGIRIGMKALETIEESMPEDSKAITKQPVLVKRGRPVSSGKKKVSRRRSWTEREMELLNNNQLATKHIAKEMKRTIGSVTAKRSRLGIKGIISTQTSSEYGGLVNLGQKLNS